MRTLDDWMAEQAQQRAREQRALWPALARTIGGLWLGAGVAAVGWQGLALAKPLWSAG